MGAMCAYVSVCMVVCVCRGLGGYVTGCLIWMLHTHTHTLRTTFTWCIIESGSVCVGVCVISFSRFTSLERRRPLVCHALFYFYNEMLLMQQRNDFKKCFILKSLNRKSTTRSTRQSNSVSRFIFSVQSMKNSVVKLFDLCLLCICAKTHSFLDKYKGDDFSVISGGMILMIPKKLLYLFRAYIIRG